MLIGNSCMNKNFDFVIIGGGILGLSIARELLNMDSRARIRIIDKEDELGRHASGRNSGVIHAGFYYTKDSLKAKFCKVGNEELTRFCINNEIPILKTGKVIVTSSDEEEKELLSLYQRGLENGVNLELLNAKYLSKFEPLAHTSENFIWSPTTSVADPLILLKKLEEELYNSGVEISKSTSYLDFIQEDFSNSKKHPKVSHIFNCSGNSADRIAKQFGFGLDYGMLPFLGIYKKTSYSNLPLRTQVYPVQNKRNPFLGIHFTKTISGDIKIGPTAIPIF